MKPPDWVLAHCRKFFQFVRSSINVRSNGMFIFRRSVWILSLHRILEHPGDLFPVGISSYTSLTSLPECSLCACPARPSLGDLIS